MKHKRPPAETTPSAAAQGPAPVHVLGFPGQLRLLYFASTLEPETVRSARWAQVEGGRAGWWMAVDGAHASLADLAQRAAAYEGRVVDASTCAQADVQWIAPRDVFLGTALRSTAGPLQPTGRVLFLLDSEVESRLDPLLDRFSRLRGWEVELEKWRVGDMEWLGIALQGQPEADPLVGVAELGIRALERLPGEGNHYVPLGFVHPLAALEHLFLADGGDEEDAWLRIEPAGPWQQARRVQGPQPLGAAVEVPFPSTAGADVPEATREELALKVQLQFGVDDRLVGLAQGRPTAAVVLRLEAWRDEGLPAALLDVIDHVQLDGGQELDDVKYMYSPRDPEGQLLYRGATHFVWVHGHGQGLARIPSDGRYRQPQAFAEAGLPIYLQEGCRFRPDLESMFEGMQDLRDLSQQLRAAFGIEDDTFAVLVEATEAPSRPSFWRLKEGPQLEESITSVFDRHWAPVLASQAQGSLGAQATADLGRLTQHHETASRDTHQALVESVAAFLAALEARAGETAAVLQQARVDLDAVSAAGDEVRTVLDTTLGAWDVLARRVQEAHAALATAAREATQERHATTGVLWKAACEAVAKLGAEQAAATQALERLVTVRDTVDSLGQAVGTLGQQVGEERSRVERRFAAEGARIEAVARDVAGTAKQVEAAVRALDSRSAPLAKACDEVDSLVKRLDGDVAARRSELQRLAQEGARAEEQLEELRATQQRVQAESTALRAKIDQIESLKRMVQQQESERAALRVKAEEHTHLETRIREQQGVLKVEAARLDEMQARLETGKASVEALREKVQERPRLEAELGAQRKILDELRDQAQRVDPEGWSSTLRSLAGQLEQLRADMEAGRRHSTREPAARGVLERLLGWLRPPEGA
ncbi:MAG: hypothetical protein ACKOCB_00130 [Planctomycetia bacterium]